MSKQYQQQQQSQQQEQRPAESDFLGSSLPVDLHETLSPAVSLSLRIIYIDYYMHSSNNDNALYQLWAGKHPLDSNINSSPPFYPQFCDPRTAGIPLPVIRIFGVTPTGQKACLHVHHCFPYLYIPYKGPLLESDHLESDAVARYIYQLGASINHALALLLKRNTGYQFIAQNQAVGYIHLVRGIPFYGYQSSYEPFLKLSILQPDRMKQIVSLLESGSILGTPFQTFESHIPYLSQFFIDYNMYGMDYIRMSDFRFRSPIYSESRDLRTSISYPYIFTQEKMSEIGYIWPQSVERTSFCELEVDCWSSNIVNRTSVAERPDYALIKPENDAFTASPTNGSLSCHLVPSLRALWDEESARRKCRLEMSSQIPEALTQSKNREPKKWPNEAQLERLLQESIASASHSSTSEQSECKAEYLMLLPTVFESIGRMYLPTISTTPETEQEGVDCQFSIPSDFMEDVHFSQFKQFSQECELEVDIDQLCSIAEVEKNIHRNDFESGYNPAENIFADEKLEEIGQLDETMEDFWEYPLPVDSEPFSETDFKSFKIPQLDGVWDSPESQWQNRYVSGSYFTSSIRTLWSPDTRLPRPPLFSECPCPKSPQIRQSSFASESSSVFPQKPARQTGIEFDPQFPWRMDQHPLPSSSSPISIPQNSTPRSDTESSGCSFSLFRFSALPPSLNDLKVSAPFYNLPETIHRKPFFSNCNDIPPPRIYAGREFKFKPDPPLEPFAPELPSSWAGSEIDRNLSQALLLDPSIRMWTPPILPPSRLQIHKWIVEQKLLNSTASRFPQKKVRTSQLQIPTPANTFNFKHTQIRPSQQNNDFEDHISLFCLEIHVNTRKDLFPDPRLDEVSAVFFSLQPSLSYDVESSSENTNDKSTNDQPLESNRRYYSGVILVEQNDSVKLDKSGLLSNQFQLIVVPDEQSLFETLILTVRECDPDILLGYEIQGASWGYLAERSQYRFDINLMKELSRVLQEKAGGTFAEVDDEYGATHQSSLHMTGRIILNVWRLMKSELNLTSYTLENIVYHVLHRRIPKFSHEILTTWYSGGRLNRRRTIKYYLDRSRYPLEILNANGWLCRTSHFARIYGIDFNSVISRGSQYRVESVMARITRPENFVMISPSRKQVAQMPAVECIPLVMEPVSRVYTDPMAVLDFQSLYPSLMMAYNYCFSTCIGRISSSMGQGNASRLGVRSDYVLPPETLLMLKDHITIAPNGYAFVKPYIRRGVLPRMVQEIIDTRIMIKKSIKLYPECKSLLNILNARQLGLKLLANVTYGYAGASFSGRMPFAELADAIVQSGRIYLESSIRQIQQNPEWNAKVVYGDTDSLFVLLSGRTKFSAFQIGCAIAEHITNHSASPMKLKFEKIYLPSVLLAKKRYVGFKYEHASDESPDFDAKGIETVRRDGCPAVGKIMECTLKILARTADLSAIKAYLYEEWTKILTGDVSVQDFIIAKAVKLGTYSNPPPGAVLSLERMEMDARKAPQYGERVPFVVVYRDPGDRLIDCVVPPYALALYPGMRLNGVYYITKQIIPALARIFNLLGVDVESWYRDMPKTLHLREVNLHASFGSTSNNLDLIHPNRRANLTMEHFFRVDSCANCHVACEADLCSSCLDDKVATFLQLNEKLNWKRERANAAARICASCCGTAVPNELNGDSRCSSLDCPIYYSRIKADQEQLKLPKIEKALKSLFEW